MTRSLPRREPLLVGALRALVHAIGAGVFAFPLTVPEAVFAAAFGGAVGSVAGRLVAGTRLRLPVILLGALAAFVTALGSRTLLLDGWSLADTLGPARALRGGDVWAFGSGTFCVSTALRAMSSRRPSFTILEVGLVAVAFAQLVAAHRNGAINRPFAIADPIIAWGGDPTAAMLAIGALAAVTIVLLLLTERSLWRSAFHLATAAALLLLVVGLAATFGLPPPPETGGGLGLRSENKESERERERQRPQGGQGRRSNEELEFRDNYDNETNRVPVAVVLLHDDYSPPTGLYYFRQGAFSQYNGRRLVSATRADVDRDLAPHFPTSTLAIDDPPRVGGYRTTLDTTVALLADHKRPFALEAPVSMEPAPNPDPRRFRRLYRATSAALTADYFSMLGSEAGDPAWSAEQRSHYTSAPTDPRYRSLAEEIVQDLPDHLGQEPIARALAVSQWLSDNGVYSLKSKHAQAKDPTASFLFGDRTGYCVHFAHAAAYLMRTLGLPSRVATGYAVEEAARAGGSALMLSGSASHAWPETYVDGAGWVIVDVAPQTVLSAAPPPPDPDLQRLLGELARGQRPLPPPENPLPPVRESARALLVALGWAAAVGLGCLFLFLSAVKVWRRHAPHIASPRRLPRVLYRAELDRLSDLRLSRHFGETREGFARRVSEVAPSFRAMTDYHLAAAFAPAAGLSAAPGEDVRHDLRRAFPWYKRWLGALTPWSWLTSR